MAASRAVAPKPLIKNLARDRVHADCPVVAGLRPTWRAGTIAWVGSRADQKRDQADARHPGRGGGRHCDQQAQRDDGVREVPAHDAARGGYTRRDDTKMPSLPCPHG